VADYTSHRRDGERVVLDDVVGSKGAVRTGDEFGAPNLFTSEDVQLRVENGSGSVSSKYFAGNPFDLGCVARPAIEPKPQVRPTQPVSFNANFGLTAENEFACKIAGKRELAVTMM
jgi:hypothetical protein